MSSCQFSTYLFVFVSSSMMSILDFVADSFEENSRRLSKILNIKILFLNSIC